MSCSFVGVTHFHLKPLFRQREAHCMSVQVVRVQVGYVICWFPCVISFNQRVARLCVAFAYHGDAASHPSREEKVDVLISQELKLHSRLFQKSVPAQSRQAKVMRRIQPLFIHAEVFEDICQQQHVRPSCDIMLRLHRVLVFSLPAKARRRTGMFLWLLLSIGLICVCLLLSLCGPVIAIFRRAS